MQKELNAKQKVTTVALSALAISAIAGGTMLSSHETGNPPSRSDANTVASSSVQASSLDRESSTESPRREAPLSGGNVEEDSWSDVVHDVTPALVSIRVEGQQGQQGIGSGVVFDKEGHVITNHHVVATSGSRPPRMQVVLSDSSVYDAAVVQTDETSDLAVLRIRNAPKDLTPIEFEDSGKLSQGDDVLALGSPLGLNGTATDGIVSAVNRPVGTGGGERTEGSSSIISGIQTNAAINVGNSGGPLVNRDGKLVGINSSIATTGNSSGNIGIGFAVPSNTVKNVTNYLRYGSEFPYGRLGLVVGAGTARNSKGTYLGAAVQESRRGSAGARAGISKGDVVIAIDGQRVVSHDALVGIVNTREAGSTVKVTYVRNGQERTADVTLDKASN